jgi:hypothetical protein
MKYLIVMREFYEPDNNTPSDKIWAKVEDIEDKHSISEEDYIKQYKEDEAYDATIRFIPLEDLTEWEKLEEIW